MIPDEDDSERVSACEIAIRLKKTVDDNMIFLIVLLACVMNVLLQGTIPLFNGISASRTEKIISYTMFVSGEKSAKFLTSWTQDLSSTRFDVSDGIRTRVVSELLFLAVFESIIVGLYFSPPEAFSSSNTHFVQVCLRLGNFAKKLSTWAGTFGNLVTQPRFTGCGTSSEDRFVEAFQIRSGGRDLSCLFRGAANFICLPHLHSILQRKYHSFHFKRP